MKNSVKKKQALKIVNKDKSLERRKEELDEYIKYKEECKNNKNVQPPWLNRVTPDFKHCKNLKAPVYEPAYKYRSSFSKSSKNKERRKRKKKKKREGDMVAEGATRTVYMEDC